MLDGPSQFLTHRADPIPTTLFVLFSSYCSCFFCVISAQCFMHSAYLYTWSEIDKILYMGLLVMLKVKLIFLLNKTAVSKFVYIINILPTHILLDMSILIQFFFVYTFKEVTKCTCMIGHYWAVWTAKLNERMVKS